MVLGFSIFDGKTFKNYDTKNGLVDGRIWDWILILKIIIGLAY